MICAPGRPYGLSFSCFSITEWKIINQLLSKKELKSCKKEQLCIFDTLVKKKLIDRNLKKELFKTKLKPYGESLSNYDINNILTPYKNIFKNYIHLGTFPSDIYHIFDLQNFLKESFANFSKFSIVLNLDESSKPGSHWVAIYIDSQTNTIEYFDSLARKPIKNIKNILKIIKKSFETHYNKHFKIYYNNIKHQGFDSECGVYVVYYIIARIFNYSIQDINNNIKDSQSIAEFRRYIFRS